MKDSYQVSPEPSWSILGQDRLTSSISIGQRSSCRPWISASHATGYSASILMPSKTNYTATHRIVAEPNKSCELLRTTNYITTTTWLLYYRHIFAPLIHSIFTRFQSQYNLTHKLIVLYQ